MRLRVEKSGGKWRVVDATADDPLVLDAGPANAPRRSSEDVGFYFFGGRIADPDLLRKELAADALLHQPYFFSVLGRAKRNCASGTDGKGFSVGLPKGADAEHFRSMLERTCSGASAAYSPGLLFRFFSAALLALVAVAWSVVRYGGSSRANMVSNSTWIAAHAEWTNRSRHLLSLAAESGEPLPMILLGRPRGSVRKLRQLLTEHLPQARLQLVRPLSLGAAAAAFSAVISDLNSALHKFTGFGYAPPLKRLVPILYRLCLGRVHRCWWRQSKAQAELIVYAHTGNADTSALELEQQRSGSRTVHLLHGISTGHHFTGFSDVAITKCAHDAHWHERLGGYGRTTSIAAPRPELAEGTPRWALFTNYAHPTAFSDQEFAMDYEEQVLRLVAAAARRIGKATGEVIYEPHPALHSLPERSQHRLADVVRELELSGWPSHRERGALSEFELVITTPSTIVQDALIAGTVPIIIDLAGVDADSVYGAYPFRANTDVRLVELVEQAGSDRSQSFERAWAAVGPGTIPGLRRIEALAKRP